MLRKLAREPLVHFFAIGAALFLFFQWKGGAGPGSYRIVLTRGQIEHIVAGFTRTWQRPPSEGELKGLVDDWVREEIAVREAMATGLDSDDTVIRRRLRQKLEFLIEDAVDSAPPTDVELQAWLEAHGDAYKREPEVALRQVLVGHAGDPTVDATARRLLARLEKSGPKADVASVGVATMLPSDIERSSKSDLARLFGDGFAEAALRLPLGRWAGPLESGYGLHVVFVTERKEGRLPALAEVRQAVERDLMAARHKQRLDAMYERLLARYAVVVQGRDGGK